MVYNYKNNRYNRVKVISKIIKNIYIKNNLLVNIYKLNLLS